MNGHLGFRWSGLRCLLCWNLVFLALSVGPLYGQAPALDIPLEQLMVRQFTTEDGLPSNDLNDVLSAADGYLWITSFAGLTRFDGRTFEVLDPQRDTALSTNGFVALHVDPTGKLWVGTQGDGPWGYEAGRLSPRASNGGSLSEVNSLLQDRLGDLWVGLEGFELYRYRGSEPTLVDSPALAGGIVHDILEARDGALWFATRGKGVVRLYDGQYRSYTASEGLPDEMASCLGQAEDGSIWIGLEKGLARLGEESVTTFPALDGIHVDDLLFDPLGSLWLATSKGLMRKRRGDDSFEVLRHGAGVTLDNLNSINLDPEGNLWLTSATRGLFQVHEGKFLNFSADQGLPIAKVHGVFEEASGELLVGTDEGVFRIEDRRKVLPMDLGAPLRDAKVMDFFRDRKGRLWISTYDGLSMDDGDSQRFFTTEDGLPHRHVRWVREDSRGQVWVGTIQGFAHWQEDGHFVLADELGPQATEFAFSFNETPDGRILLGTRVGLLIYSPDGSRKLYRSGKELPGGLVFSARSDAAGMIWIATPGGLARLTPDGAVSVLDRQGGLPKSSVYDLVEDDAGFVWMSSVEGAVRVPKRELDAFMDGDLPSVEVRVFDERDGMIESEFTGARKMLESIDGRLWFPTLGGLASVDPVRLPRNLIPPPVWITRMEAGGHDFQGVEVPVIPSGRQRVVFDFVALSFRAPSHVQVRYRLDGFDSEWIEAGEERTVSYTNLTPGDYTLRVVAANNDGVWNDEGAALSFRVTQNIGRILGWIALALTLVSLIVCMHRWRVRAVRRRNELLERDAVERSQLIEQLDAKNRELELFAYTASHDLKSPLVTIEGFLGLLEKDALDGDIDRIQGDLKRIRGGIRTMEQLLNGLLEVSRIGRLEDASVEVRLTDLALQASELLTAQITESGAKVDVDADLPRVLGSPSRLMQVFQNLIANAIKFAGEAPVQIDIGSRSEGSEEVIYVRDNGIGIDPEYHQKIFGLFDRLNAKTEGSGLGLAIVQRVIEVHGGRVWVESEGRGHGTTFCFTLGAGSYLESTKP